MCSPTCGLKCVVHMQQIEHDPCGTGSIPSHRRIVTHTVYLQCYVLRGAATKALCHVCSRLHLCDCCRWFEQSQAVITKVRTAADGFAHNTWQAIVAITQYTTMYRSIRHDST
eukprot:jgi/Ulvmu1/12195/UM085_0059.1